MVRRAVIERTGAVLVERMGYALTGWERFRGLMLRKGLPPEEGLLIPDCRSVHTFFMRFPIDLIYLDAERRTVKIVPSKAPCRLSGCLRARSVLETAAGRAAQAGLQEGDRIIFCDISAI